MGCGASSAHYSEAAFDPFITQADRNPSSQAAEKLVPKYTFAEGVFQPAKGPQELVILESDGTLIDPLTSPRNVTGPNNVSPSPASRQRLKHLYSVAWKQAAMRNYLDVYTSSSSADIVEVIKAERRKRLEDRKDSNGQSTYATGGPTTRRGSICSDSTAPKLEMLMESQHYLGDIISHDEVKSVTDDPLSTSPCPSSSTSSTLRHPRATAQKHFANLYSSTFTMYHPLSLSLCISLLIVYLTDHLISNLLFSSLYPFCCVTM